MIFFPFHVIFIAFITIILGFSMTLLGFAISIVGFPMSFFAFYRVSFMNSATTYRKHRDAVMHSVSVPGGSIIPRLLLITYK